MRQHFRFWLAASLLFASMGAGLLPVAGLTQGVEAVSNSPGVVITINSPSSTDILSNTVTVSVTALVTNTTISKVVFKVDGQIRSSQNAASNLTTWSPSWSWNTKADETKVGPRVLSVLVTDAAGDYVAASETVTLTDWLTPTISSSNINTSAGKVTYVRSTYSIPINLQDNVGVTDWAVVTGTLSGGVITNSTSITNVTVATPKAFNRVTFPWNTTTISDGNYSVLITATDATTTTPSLGNVAVAGPYSVTVDNTPPAFGSGGVQMSTPYTTSISNGSVISGAVLITVPVQDATSGLTARSVTYHVDSKPPVTLAPTGTFTSVAGVDTYTGKWDTTAFANNLTHTVTIAATDNAGNVLTSTYSFSVTDYISPTIRISGVNNNSFYRGTVTLGGTASDNVKVASWAINTYTSTTAAAPNSTIASQTVTTYTAPVTLRGTFTTTALTDGEYWVGGVVTDEVGNIGVTARVPMTVDNTPPVINAVGGITPTELVSGTIPITASVYDATSGVRVAQIKIDNQTINMQAPSNASATVTGTYTYNWNTALYTVGTHIVTVFASDKAGNVSSLSSNVYTVTEPTWITPTVSLTGLAANASVMATKTLSLQITDAQKFTGWNLHAQGASYTVPITSSSGISLTTYGASYQWNTTAITTDGQYGLVLTATNSAGIVATSKIVTVTVDNTAPVLSSGGIVTGTTISGNQTITATASDATSGLHYAQVFVDGHGPYPMISGSTISLTGTNNFTYAWNTAGVADGKTHTVVVKATDYAGNVTSNTTVVTVADWITPAVTIQTPSTGQYIHGALTATGFASDNVGVVTPTLLVTNTGTSAVTTYTGTIQSGSGTKSLSLSVAVTPTLADGLYTFQWKAQDLAGNTGYSLQHTNVMIDNTAPTVSVTTTAAITGIVPIQITTNDPTTNSVSSGVSYTKLTITGSNSTTVNATLPSSYTTYNWSSGKTGLTGVTFTVTAVTYDKAGNASTSSTFTVTHL